MLLDSNFLAKFICGDDGQTAITNQKKKIMCAISLIFSSTASDCLPRHFTFTHDNAHLHDKITTHRQRLLNPMRSTKWCKKLFNWTGTLLRWSLVQCCFCIDSSLLFIGNHSRCHPTCLVDIVRQNATNRMVRLTAVFRFLSRNCERKVELVRNLTLGLLGDCHPSLHLNMNQPHVLHTLNVAGNAVFSASLVSVKYTTLKLQQISNIDGFCERHLINFQKDGTGAGKYIGGRKC
mmetsp:Transcript_22425/g.62269  ORF Transcript_22425/g.62269 Transcript_22425/m.62269 type:complete len:235 (-) Transcript_22425:1005-1709(-)